MLIGRDCDGESARTEKEKPLSLSDGEAVVVEGGDGGDLRVMIIAPANASDVKGMRAAVRGADDNEESSLASELDVEEEEEIDAMVCVSQLKPASSGRSPVVLK